jgi:hypothetical protein
MMIFNTDLAEALERDNMLAQAVSTIPPKERVY